MIDQEPAHLPPPPVQMALDRPFRHVHVLGDEGNRPIELRNRTTISRWTGVRLPSASCRADLALDDTSSWIAGESGPDQSDWKAPTTSLSYEGLCFWQALT